MPAAPSRARAVLLTALAAAVVGAAYIAGAAGGATAPTAVREPLAASDTVRGATGRTLALSRVTVPGGALLALHHHPGTQVAYIDQGALTYTVVSGSVTVRTGSSDAPKVVRKISAGQTATIRAGQWIVEQPTTIHKAANRTTRKIVIYLSTFFPKGAPPSIAN